MSEDLQTRIVTEEILARSGKRPIHLTTIEVNGGELFSRDFFQKMLSPLLHDLDYTLNRLVEDIATTEARLAQTNVFRSISSGLHADFKTVVPLLALVYNKEPSIATKLVFNLLPININVFEGFLNFNLEDNLNLDLNYRNNNFYDNGELVDIGVHYNPYKPFDGLITNARFMSLLNNPAVKFLIDLNHCNQNNESWQQLKMAAASGVIGLHYLPSLCSLVLAGFAFAKRNLHSIGDAANDDVKFFGGDHLKTSVIGNLTVANIKYLDVPSRAFPVSGYATELLLELSQTTTAALLAVNSFAKIAAASTYYQLLFNHNVTAKVSASAGYIHNFQADAPIHVGDRFYLGGITSLRGFTKNGINPLGGLQYYNLGATVFSKLPTFIIKSQGDEPHPLRAYALGAVGNVGDDVLSDKNVPVSLGFGVQYFDHYANFDLGYFVARRLGIEDTIGIKSGLQFSMTIGGSNLGV